MAQPPNVTGAQLRAARVLLHASQRQVAELIGVSTDTVWRAERDHPGSRRTHKQLVGVFQRNGVRFENGGVAREPVTASPGGEAQRPAP